MLPLKYILHLNFTSICSIATVQVPTGHPTHGTERIEALTTVRGSGAIGGGNWVVQRTEVRLFALFLGNSRYSVLLSVSSALFMETRMSLFLVVISRTSLLNCICSLTFVDRDRMGLITRGRRHCL